MRITFVGIVLVALSAESGAQTTRDSSGIPVVFNERPVADNRAVKLSPAPVLTIGNRAGDPYELSRVAGAVRLSDGRVIVANSSSSELRQFNADGNHVKSSGRQGPGPGEFTRIDALRRLPGDTLAVLDQQRVVKYFTSRGDHVRTVDLRNPPIAQARGSLFVIAMFPDGSRVVTGGEFPPPRARGERWTEVREFWLIDQHNAVKAALGVLPLSHYAMDDSPQRPWFGAQFTFANDARSFYYGIGDEYSILRFSPEGRVVRIIRRRWTPAPVTRSDIDAFVREWGKRWVRGTGPEADARYADIRDDPYAPTVPAYSQFMVDPNERLWVREPHVADAAWAGQLYGVPLVPSTWNVFDNQGRWLFDVLMPARFLVTEIGSDYVLGVARGADDLETVVMYRLVRR